LFPLGIARPPGNPAATEALGRLDAVARRLDPPAGVQVEMVLLHGEPAKELLDFAEQQRIDMIATGAHGRTPVERLVLGSVSTKIVRSAQCWVLVAPAQQLAPREKAESFEPDAQPIG